MGTDSFIGWQFGMTLIAVLAIGVFLFLRARRSQQKRGEAPGEVVAGQPSAHNPNPSTPRH